LRSIIRSPRSPATRSGFTQLGRCARGLFPARLVVFPAAARELLVGADDHQQLNAIGGCLFGVFPDLVCEIDGITDEIGFLHFALSETLLVTGRHRPLGAITATRNALKTGRNVPTLAALMDTILECVVDSVDRYGEEVQASSTISKRESSRTM
jgi:hypothetical protein